MKEITRSLVPGEISIEDEIEFDLGVQGRAPRGGGAEVRELFALLHELDRSHTWGKLTRTVTETGDSIWICPQHRAIYDPPLPKL